MQWTVDTVMDIYSKYHHNTIPLTEAMHRTSDRQLDMTQVLNDTQWFTHTQNAWCFFENSG